MCGIVGFIGKREASPILLDGLQKLEYRGYDSAGIAVLNDGKIEVDKTLGYIKGLIEKTHNGKDIKGEVGIGHTRWATHGAPSVENAHPHLSDNGKIAVVHNGIIENYISLREELISLGFKFKSETDTEVVAHLVEYYYEQSGDMLSAIYDAKSRLEGSYALGIINTDCPDHLFAVRKSSPLIIGIGEGENFIASDVTALIVHTRDIMYLEDGNVADMTRDKVTLYKHHKIIDKDIDRITWDINAAEKGGYEHFMLKEIMEQPEVVKKTVEARIKDNKIVLDDMTLTAGQMKDFRRIVITACGSASYAGQAARFLMEELLRIPVEIDLASELRYRNPVIDEHTLLIVLSQSGETADTIAAMKEAKTRGARVLSIVNVVGSTIAKLSDDVLYTWAGPEIAVATTKGYTTQVALLYLFTIYAAGLMKSYPADELEHLLGEVRMLPEYITEAIEMNTAALPVLAKKYAHHHDIFFIGRNLDSAVAMEGSLKLKEISYLHSESYAAGELKHGTISLIEDRTLVIALCCYEPLFDKLMSNIKEVKARGALVLSTAISGNTSILTESDDVIWIPKTDMLINAPVQVVPLQLLAYYIAKENGCSIDKPKNLAKSVTVE